MSGGVFLSCGSEVYVAPVTRDDSGGYSAGLNATLGTGTHRFFGVKGFSFYPTVKNSTLRRACREDLRVSRVSSVKIEVEYAKLDIDLLKIVEGGSIVNHGPQIKGYIQKGLSLPKFQLIAVNRNSSKGTAVAYVFYRCTFESSNFTTKNKSFASGDFSAIAEPTICKGWGTGGTEGSRGSRIYHIEEISYESSSVQPATFSVWGSR